MEKEFKIKSFNCEENLSQYISSMLFDSGEEIATGVFSYGDDELEVTLQVSGEVAVTFKDEVYHRPSDSLKSWFSLSRNIRMTGMSVLRRKKKTMSTNVTSTSG